MNITKTRTLLIKHLIELNEKDHFFELQSEHDKNHFFELQSGHDMCKNEHAEQVYQIVRNVALAYLDSTDQSSEFLNFEYLNFWVHVLLNEYYHEETLRKLQCNEDKYTLFFNQFTN